MLFRSHLITELAKKAEASNEVISKLIQGKKLKAVGRVEVPQEAFMAVLSLSDD